jgi:hypothetical protein
VSHPLLLYKLQELGIKGNLLKWFRSYINNRYQRVVVNGGTSKWLPVISGVPQGSILGPLLFTIFINDIPTVTQYSKVLLYADDTKCYNCITSVTDCLNLQSDLDLLYDWSVKWKLKFNAAKCKVLTVSRSKAPTNFYYNLNGYVLQRVNNIKDLGVTVSHDLNWSTHIDNIVSTANKVSGLIKRTLGYNATSEVKKQLYLSMVRSNVEYCSQIWSGTSRFNVVKIERIQRSATRYIMNYPNIDYGQRLQSLNILPLCYRREVLDATFFYKCVNDVYQLDINMFVNFSSNSDRSTRSSIDLLHLCNPISKTESGKKLYFRRIVSLWNSLPYCIRNANSVTSFKILINNHYRSLIYTDFIPDRVCTWSILCTCPICRPY